MSSHITPQERLKELLLSEKKDLWIIVIYGAATGLFSLIIPIAVQALVNTIGFGSMLQPIFVLTFLVFTFLVFAGIMSILQSVAMEIVQQRIFARIAMELSYRLPRVQIRAYDSNEGPELVNRFFDVLIVQKSAAIILLDGVAIALQTILGMVLVAFYHPYLLAFDLVLIVFAFLIYVGLGRNAIPTSVDESIKKYAVAAWLEELAKNPLTFKSYGGPELAFKNSDRLTADYIRSRKHHFQILLRQIVGSISLQVIASSLLLGLGGWLVVHRQLTLGQLVAAELVINTVMANFSKFGKYLETYYDLVAAADKLGYLFDLPLEKTGKETLNVPKGPASVQLQKISFNYKSGTKTLSDLDLMIQPGSRVAIVGENGTGKSTLVSLIFGLRTPNSGSVQIDGLDIREIPIEKLRPQIGFVRGVEIFQGTVLENIRVNRPELSLKEIRDTLESLHLLQDLSSLPDGLNTQLVGSHPPLSSGQAQRLVIARAIVGKPRLLILDESLDNIDADSYKKVIKVLFDRNAPWTLILTTHNKELSQSCDQTYFISEGKIITPGATPK